MRRKDTECGKRSQTVGEIFLTKLSSQLGALDAISSNWLNVCFVLSGMPGYGETNRIKEKASGIYTLIRRKHKHKINSKASRRDTTE